MIKHLLFDLDGTLIDSSAGVLSSVAYALTALGRPVPPRRELMPFLGPPLEYSFMHFSGMSESDARRAVEAYRAYYTPKGIDEYTLYPGIREMLSTLCDGGFTLALATSKPEVYAAHILDASGMSRQITALCGALLPKGRDDKNEVITCLMAREGYAPAETAMIGDRFYDIAGAHACGLAAIGVTYGFGSREELAEAGADALCESPAEVAHFFLTKGRNLNPQGNAQSGETS